MGFGQQRFHGRQRLRRDLRVIGDACHEQVDARYRDHRAEFMFDGVIRAGTTRPMLARAPITFAVVKGICSISVNAALSEFVDG